MALIILIFSLLCGLAQANPPRITAVSTNGAMIWTNAAVEGYYRVEWSPDISDTNAWRASWSNLVDFGGTTTRTIHVETPRFFRLAWDSNAWTAETNYAIGTDETEYPFPYSGPVDMTNIDSGARYAIDWLDGTNWSRSWTALGNIAATGLQHSCSVPMLMRLRVLSTNVPPDVPGMAWVFAGAYMQGTPTTQALATISGVYMDRYEVSEGLWEDVRLWALTNGYTDLPSGSRWGTNYPVTRVSWWESVRWCNARSAWSGLTPLYVAGTNVVRTAADTGTVAVAAGSGYRLPTEAEWERGARGFLAGSYFPWGGSNDMDAAGSQANFRNSGDIGEYYHTQLTPCGGYIAVPTWFAGYPGTPGEDDGGSQWVTYVYQYHANGYGLFDMAGNVWEWCWDRYSRDAYPHSGTNYAGPDTGSRRVVRGGCYGSVPRNCTVYSRSPARPDQGKASIGFRCVRSRQ